ncbi:MAG: hypothetical protein ACREMZ_07415 [Gemmatimonadales bacterium]
MRMPARFAATIMASLVSLAWCSPALGQWAVTGEVGSDRFWGGSVESAAEHRSFRPYRPTTFGIGLERQSAGLGVGIRFRYASAGLALEGPRAVVALKGIFRMYSVAPEISHRLRRFGSGNELLVQGGPLLEVWSVRSEHSQTRIGLHAALSLRVPLVARLAGSFTAGAAVTPSPFATDQLDEGFERSALWRRRLAAGLEYRW